MEKKINKKIYDLINTTRVMTIAVADNDVPWSSPVYFVFHDSKFYFFSNENSKHIRYAKVHKAIAASIFQDSDQMHLIFGFQMSGRVEKVSKKSLYLLLIKKYITKFKFLKQIFGPEIIDNKIFFLERFKSHLYCFFPADIFLSDNSKPTDKRVKIDLNNLDS